MGRGRSRLSARNPMWDWIPGPRDHAPSQRQTHNCWATRVSCIFSLDDWLNVFAGLLHLYVFFSPTHQFSDYHQHWGVWLRAFMLSLYLWGFPPIGTLLCTISLELSENTSNFWKEASTHSFGRKLWVACEDIAERYQIREKQNHPIYYFQMSIMKTPKMQN